MLDMFQVAAKIACSKVDQRYYLVGAVGIRADGTIVRAANSPSPDRNYNVHAEAKLARKLDVGATVFVARVRRLDGQFAIAKPCFHCERVLRSRGVKKVFYTMGPDEYESMNYAT